MKKTFREMCDELWDFPIENSREKTVYDVMDEIFAFIESCGWEHFTYSNMGEWLDSHPELDDDECQDILIASFDYMCKNDCEMDNGHDMDWYQFDIYCYGKFTETEVNGAFHFD